LLKTYKCAVFAVKFDFLPVFLIFNGFKKNQQMRFFVFSRLLPWLHFCNVKEQISNRAYLTLMQKYLLTSIFLFLAGVSYGQGWYRIFGGGGSDGANSICKTPDGGYALAGYYNFDRIFIVKTDADGNQQWAKNYIGTGQQQAQAICTTSDSGIVVAGYILVSGKRNVLIMKTDAFGNKLWTKTYGVANQDEEITDIVELPDGSLVMTGVESPSNSNLIVLKTDNKGNQLWYKSFGQAGIKERGNGIIRHSSGDLVVVGTRNEALIYALRLNPADGSVVWENEYDSALGTGENGNGIAEATDGQLLVVGRINISGMVNGYLSKIDAAGAPGLIWTKTKVSRDYKSVAVASNGNIYVTGNNDVESDLMLARFQADGTEVWSISAGKGGAEEGRSVVVANDGGAVAAGSLYPSILEERAYLVKTDANGVLFTSYIHANIFWDGINPNCQPDAGENGLRDWIAVVANQFDTVYAVSQANGRFMLAVDTGLYTVRLYNTNAYWETCTPFVTVHVPAFYDTVDANVAVRRAFDCPRNEVDIATPILRRCIENTFTVRYCNSGTIPSQDTRVEVTLDPALSVTSASVPYTQQGNLLKFEIGTLNNANCNSFTFKAFLDCNAEVGQTHCATAHIYPDTFCNTQGWDGSILQARGNCQNDSVQFRVKNIGQAPFNGNLETVGFVIAEEVILLTPPNDPLYRVPSLTPGEDVLLWSMPMADGKTYRIILDGQSSGYPGNSRPTAAVEGCQPDTSMTPPSYGFYTMFPEDDNDVFVSVHCQETAETDFHPTFLKRGHPKGVGVPKYVSPETDLDYLIQFENTGADTVQQVIVRDTLSAALDPASVVPGSASHPYNFQVYGTGIVEFTIPNAQLLPQGEGFVKFRVSQKSGLPCGTEVLNRADVYYDFNAPESTGETLHTICKEDEWLVVNTENVQWPNARVVIAPNPMNDVAQIEVKGVQAKTYTLHVYDIQGRMLANPTFTTPTFRLYRQLLPAGILIYQVTADGRPVASGKLIVK
jgi:uncharacterized repeat protein (TIGR01451 family)